MAADTETAVKTCSDCGKTKPLEQFYRNRNMADGRLSRCKVCHRPVQRKWDAKQRHGKNREAVLERHRAGNRAYKARHRDRVRAHKRVWNAIRDGRLVRPEECERCGSACRPHAHHADYSKPLEVEWLCEPCHQIEHFRGAL